MNGFEISTNFDDMNLPLIHDFISDTYWAKGIPLETLTKAVRHSLCFGVFESDGEQVGFARVITDQATFAYLADVFILDNFRGRGLSKWLLETVVGHPQLQGLRRFVLATRDAHGLYQQFGFKPLSSPQIFMEIWDPQVYRTNSG